ncbi:MAG: polyprenol monophosphomannose synthase [Myxococcales bacterium]|nr:polyprenol monophosphomannose synthase [Myxococcales bacterium]
MRPVICLPTYCERENLGPLVQEILEVAPTADVLVVDSASPDGTGQLADELAGQYPRVKAMHIPGPGSMAAAYVQGFKAALAADYDVVVQMDADFSHQPRYLPGLLEGLTDADVSIGSRYVHGGGVEQWSLGRRVVSRAGNLYVGAVLSMPYKDTTSGFVAWRRHVLEAVDFEDLHAEGRAFQVELKFRAHRLGFTLVEVPIHFWDRVVGASKLTPKSAVDSMVSVLKFRIKGE